MFETTVEFAFIEHLAGYGFIPPLGDPGFPRVLDKFRKPYRTADGYACILPYSDRNWQDFFDFTGRTEFKDDVRFTALESRVQNIEILYATIEVEAVHHATAEWVAFCDRVSIPCMPVLAQTDLPDDPHLQAVGFFGTAQHPTEGAIRTLRPPVTFSETPCQIRFQAPGLGEHTNAILRELGLAAPIKETAP